MAKELLPVIGSNHAQLGLPFDWKAGGLPPPKPSTTCLAYSLQGRVQTRLSLCEDLPREGETDFEVYHSNAASALHTSRWRSPASAGTREMVS